MKVSDQPTVKNSRGVCGAFLLLAGLCLLPVSGVLAEEKEDRYAELGIVSLPLSREKTESGVKAVMRLSVSGLRRCMFSDLDAIALDAMSMPEPKFIVSLEPLSLPDSKFYPIATPLTSPLKITQGGLPLELRFPFVQKPELLGIYICGDGINAGQCTHPQKKLIDFGKHFQTYRSPRPTGYVAPDKVYFFRPLLLDSNTVSFPTKAMTPERYSLLREYFGEKLGRKVQQQEYNKFKNASEKLTSMPLRPHVNQVRVDLPFFDKRRCEAQLEESEAK